MKPTTATPSQLRRLLTAAARQLNQYNRRMRGMYPHALSLQIAKTEVLLSKCRKAVKAKGRA